MTQSGSLLSRAARIAAVLDALAPRIYNMVSPLRLPTVMLKAIREQTEKIDGEIEERQQTYGRQNANSSTLPCHYQYTHKRALNRMFWKECHNQIDTESASTMPWKRKLLQTTLETGCTKRSKSQQTTKPATANPAVLQFLRVGTKPILATACACDYIRLLSPTTLKVNKTCELSSTSPVLCPVRKRLCGHRAQVVGIALSPRRDRVYAAL